MRRWLQRLLKPDFWVCEYRSRGGYEVGSFACFGKSHQGARSDAASYLMEMPSIAGWVDYTVRRPSVIERMDAGRYLVK